MTSPSHLHDPEPKVVAEETLQTQNPNLTQDEDSQPLLPQEQLHSQTQSPQTLETQDPQNPEKSDPDQEDPQVQELEEQESGMFISLPPPPIADLNPLITSPTNNPYRKSHKRKKFGHMKKKQQTIDKKVQNLLENLNLVPFMPSKNLDFPKHEKLLKRLGLWDFAQIKFDISIRADLVAQLIVTCDLPKRSSHVNGFRIAVNRADLARALKLPLPAKKEKSSGNVLEGVVDLDWEESSEESISFMEDFVSSWVLLHEDAWITTSEVRNWMQLIKDGHPEKVDWASLFWHMVENELKQGVQLVDCYYASHLQYLIKSQREELLREEPRKVELDVEVKEDDDGGLNESSRGEDNVVLEDANTELTLGGQDIVEKEEIKGNDLMDVEESKDEEQGQWDLAVKNSTSEHFLQPCCVGEDRGVGSNEESKHEVEEEEMDMEEQPEDGAGCDLAPNYDSLEGTDLNSNLLQEFEATQLTFGSQGQQLHGQSSMELLASRTETHMIMSGPSIFGNNDKRAIEYEQDTSQLNGSNKRMRTDVLWDHKSSDFGFCMGQVQQLMEKAKIMYEAKEQAFQESNVTQQILLGELQQRDNLIEQLHKIKVEELEKKEGEIFRLERELHLMGNLLDGYRKALKETNMAFFEYRQRCQLPEEPIYKDAGPGGLVLSITELEKQRQKQEEEDRLNRMMIEQKYNEKLEMYIGMFDEHFLIVQVLDTRLTSCENEVKLLKEMSAKRKSSEVADCAPSE